MKDTKVNSSITSKEVFVIDDTGNKLGKMSRYDALRKADERNLDLVEVSPGANPPVCKLMDYGKFQYEQKKKRKETKQHVPTTKEIRLRPNIDDNDLNTKANRANGFLKSGDKVLIKVLMRGRENIHPELGFKLIEKFCENLSVEFRVDKDSKHEGRNITRTVVPNG